MNALNEYIDGATKLVKLCIDKKGESQEAKDLEKKLAILWEQLTEEERLYADEQVIRMQIYLS
jgi:hypothetical protein